MDLGSELREARERRGLSLHQMSERTKITASTLRALENNDVTRLPGGIFTRGFLRAYAREVGLDPRLVMERYAAAFPDVSGPAADRGDASAIADGGRADREPEAMPRAAVHVNGAAFARAAAAMAIVGIGYFGFVWARTGSPRGAPPVAGAVPVAAMGSASEPSTAAPAKEAATTGATADVPAEAPVPPVADTLRVEIESRGPCWISATADGERVAYRLMQPGERLTIAARDELLLRLGDGGAIAMSVNGHAVRSLGATGEVVSARMTRENYRDFLAK